MAMGLFGHHFQVQTLVDGFKQGFAFKQFVLGLIIVVIAALHGGAGLVN